ncbi:MAG: translation initiation factor IF-2 subunit gamma [Candidatus Woesearchaeota archaeon]
MAKKAKHDDNVTSSQPEINIGLVGHVDHGKTTLTEKFSGKWTDTHSEELKRGITIRLGYADAIFRKCVKCDEYTVKEKCEVCGSETVPVRKVSFVDAPGHESLMATMLSGATIMDGAYLLIAANEDCPQPQTREHLMALNIIGIKNVIIIQNKVDMVDDKEAMANYKQIKEFLKGTNYESAPIVPVSARYGVNIGAIIEATQQFIPTPKRDPDKNPILLVARSFDINKPGIDGTKIVGGVLGGALMQGTLKVGDQIELRPGHEIEHRNQKVYEPLTTKVVGLMTGNLKVEQIFPGGSVGVLTSLDPSVAKSDFLTGSVAGLPDLLPATRHNLLLEINLLQRVVGAKDDLLVEQIKLGETLMLNVNAAATVGIVKTLKKELIEFSLKLPVCADPGARVTLSRRIDNRWRLIGYGIIRE